MDPNANLEEQINISNRIINGTGDMDDMDDAERLAELVLALDEWIERGGFLPRRWKNVQRK